MTNLCSLHNTGEFPGIQGLLRFIMQTDIPKLGLSSHHTQDLRAEFPLAWFKCSISQVSNGNNILLIFSRTFKGIIVVIFFFFFFFFVFWGPPVAYGTSPGWGGFEVQLVAFTPATAMCDSSPVYSLHYSSRECGIPGPLSKARD